MAQRVLLTVDRLTEASDVISIGTIQETARTETPHQVAGRTVQELHRTGEITVFRYLKGESLSKHVLVAVRDTFDPAGGIPSAFPIEGTCRMFFLRQTTEQFEFVSSFPGSLPAICAGNAEDGAPLDLVVSQVLRVLNDSSTTIKDKLEVLSSLYQVENPRIGPALERTSDTGDPVLHVQLISERLRRNQISALPEAVKLLKRAGATPQYLLPNLDYAIRDGIRNEEAIPILKELLVSNNVEDRRAASSALRGIGTEAILEGLSTAIFDPDLEVQYYAIMGLARLTEQQEWLPNAEEFRAEHSKYIKYWRDWVKNHRR